MYFIPPLPNRSAGPRMFHMPFEANREQQRQERADDHRQQLRQQSQMLSEIGPSRQMPRSHVSSHIQNDDVGKMLLSSENPIVLSRRTRLPAFFSGHSNPTDTIVDPSCAADPQLKAGFKKEEEEEEAGAAAAAPLTWDTRHRLGQTPSLSNKDQQRSLLNMPTVMSDSEKRNIDPLSTTACEYQKSDFPEKTLLVSPPSSSHSLIPASSTSSVKKDQSPSNMPREVYSTSKPVDTIVQPCRHKGLWRRILASHHITSVGQNNKNLANELHVNHKLTNVIDEPYRNKPNFYIQSEYPDNYPESHDDGPERVVLVTQRPPLPTQTATSSSIANPPETNYVPSNDPPNWIETATALEHMNLLPFGETEVCNLDSNAQLSEHEPQSSNSPSSSNYQSLTEKPSELSLKPHVHHLSPPPVAPIKANKKSSGPSQQSAKEQQKQHLPQHHLGFGIFKDIWHRNDPSTGNAKRNKSIGGHFNIGIRRSQSEHDLAMKYGTVQEVIGKGTGGVVKLAHKHEGTYEKLFALKEFRRRQRFESEKDYLKRLLQEFCISSALNHPHIVTTIDLLQDEQKHWVEVMEFCQGGDLYSVIHDHGPLNQTESNCFFKQLILGVSFLHKNGIAHRDLKPENLVLDANGCLKITDFGSAEIIQNDKEKQAHKSRGVCGSTPYIAPEEWSPQEFDARKVDVWSCGIIYFVMVYSRIPWKIAALQDPNYRYFLSHRSGRFSPIDNLESRLSALLNQILEPDSNMRLLTDQILEDPYFKSLKTCQVCDENLPAASTKNFKESVSMVKERKKVICDKVGF